MADEQPNKENEVTPKGAVEIKEEDLDQASGGAAYLKMPKGDFSDKIDLTPPRTPEPPPDSGVEYVLGLPIFGPTVPIRVEKKSG